MNMKEYFLVYLIHINGIFLNIIFDVKKYSLTLKMYFHVKQHIQIFHDVVQHFYRLSTWRFLSGTPIILYKLNYIGLGRILMDKRC